MVVGYIRVSTDQQTVENQRHVILDYSNKNRMHVDHWVEVNMSTRKSIKSRKITELMDMLSEGDTVIVTEQSRIGRSLIDVLEIQRQIIDKGVTLIMIKEGMCLHKDSKSPMDTFMINMMGSYAQLERDLISMRTKEALAARKAQGMKLGKPKGTIQASMYDEHKEKIFELHELGLPLPKIISYIGIGKPKSLKQYIQKVSNCLHYTPHLFFIDDSL